MVASRAHRDVGAALAGVAGALEALEFGPDTADLAADRDRLAGTICSYLIPRAIEPGQPMVVVLAGPTGSGKSTLVNSLSGLDVSTTGALRPTTRIPMVLAPADAADRFRSIGGVRCEVAPGEARLLDHLVLVDAPDIDSTAIGHRAMAETLIDHADLVIFVSSALRYADEVPWQVLRRAVSRGTPVIHVLNRVTSSSSGAIVDFRSRLSAAGYDDELIMVSEHHLSDEAQRVPSLAVRSLRARLGDLVASHHDATGEIFDRVLASTMTQVTDLARSMAAIADEIDGFEAELTVDLAERPSALDLSGVGSHLYPEPPAQRTRRGLRRWRKTVGDADTAAVDRATSRLIDGIQAIIHTDVRRWLVRERAMARDWNIDPVTVIAGTNRAARSHLEGWAAFVGRIAAETDERHVWLGQAILLDAATTQEPVGAVSLALGEDGDVLVDRARRELTARLGLIYEHLAILVAGEVRARHGSLDVEGLRSSLGAITAFAPVDA